MHTFNRPNKSNYVPWRVKLAGNEARPPTSGLDPRYEEMLRKHLEDVSLEEIDPALVKTVTEKLSHPVAAARVLRQITMEDKATREGQCSVLPCKQGQGVKVR
jgi:hypothetical protein